MPKLDNKAEMDAYYLADPPHPRAAGVMWPALVERRLDRLFETGLRPDTVVRNELFQPSGALGNYAVKVRMAYLLGWIEREVYDDLLLLSKIRNRFAHDIEAKDFSDDRIDKLLKKMKVYQLLPRMLETWKARVQADPSVVNKAGINVIENALSDGRMGLRFCIDQMLIHLEKCQAHMEKNLKDLPGNWLVAEPAASETKASSATPSPKP